MMRLANAQRFLEPVFEYDLDFQLWIDANILLGHTLPSEEMLLVGNQYVLDSKADGIWDGEDRVHLMAWNDLDCADASLVCLKTRVVMTVHGGCTYTLDGWKGNAVDGYIRTYFVPSRDATNYELTDAGRGVLNSNNASTSNAVMGSLNNNSYHSMYLSNGSDANYQRMNSPSPHTTKINFTGVGLKTQYIDVDSNYRAYNKDVEILATSGLLASVTLDEELVLFRRGSGKYGNDTVGYLFFSKRFSQIENESLRTNLNTFLVGVGLTAYA